MGKQIIDLNMLPHEFHAATTIANGAILVDDYDTEIFDDVLRDYPVWNMIDKRPAIGDYTNGFDQTAIGNARSTDKRNMSFSATSPTRVARTPKEMKAIVRDLQFGIYDRSVYRQQGSRFGDLTAKDVSDVYHSILRRWSALFYDGDTDNDPYEFDGLKDSHLIGSGSTVLAAASVVRAIQEAVVSMMNTTTRDVMPTDILVNAQVRQYIAQEYRLAGDKMPEATNERGEKVGALDTAAGTLPITVDRWLTSVAGTPVTYPTFIIDRKLVSWQYIEPLGQAGPDPKVFEIVMNNALDTQYKGVIFGAVELIGGTGHATRLNVQARTTVINPTA